MTEQDEARIRQIVREELRRRDGLSMAEVRQVLRRLREATPDLKQVF
jgi:hypothetical protein